MKTNQKGFGVVEGLIIVVIVGLIGFAGWMVITNRSASQTSNVTTPPASNLKKYVFEHEKLYIEYPNDWTFTQETLPAATLAKANNDTDIVTVTSKRGLRLDISTGTVFTEHPQWGANTKIAVAKSIPLTTLGATNYLTFAVNNGKVLNVYVSSTATPKIIGATNPSSVDFDYPVSKNTRLVQAEPAPVGTNTFTTISLFYTDTAKWNSATVDDIINDPDFETAKQIIESLHY